MADKVIEKIKVSLYLGFVVGMIAGIIRASIFVSNESYAAFELKRYGLYLFQHSIETFVIWGLVGGVVFATVWILFDFAEGLTTAAFFVSIWMAPIVYYANIRLLPAFRGIESIVGNLLFGLLSFALTIFVFNRITRDAKLLRRIYSPIALGICIIFAIGVSAFYYLGPQHKRLEATPKSFGPGFINLFDFSSNGLSMDSKTHHKAILSYLEKRTEGVRQKTLQAVRSNYPDANVIISMADSIAKRRFLIWDRGGSHKLPEKIDWYENPTNDKVWLFGLNEFEWMWTLTGAYILTGDEKYAQEYAQIVESFVDQVSMPKWKNEKDPVWRLIGAGLRMSNSWLEAFYAFLPSRAISDDLKIKILGSIHDHAQFLSHFRSPHRNHLIQEAYGLLKVAAMFPEFKMADQWLEVAVERLDKALSKDVYPDGGYNEGSMFYHRYVVRLLQSIVDFAEEYAVELSDNTHSQLEKMYSFLLYTSLPDGTMPQMNDGFRTWDLRKLIQIPLKKSARSDFQYFASNGQVGLRPSKASVSFPYTGIYVMRSDWTENARYCIVDAGLFGSAHGHEDKLGFELYAYGFPFIVEAGTYTYVYNDWHRYFESSFSHNTIVVDGKGQLRQPNKKQWATNPHEKLPNKWISTNNFDYVEASYTDGYGNIKEAISHDVAHTRRFLFIKPDYWILWDILTGKGNHKFEQIFHFAPIQIDTLKDSKAILARYENGPNLLLHPLYTQNLSVQQIVGSENPRQGWISPVYGEKIPAPAIIYTRVQEVPAVFVQILTPFQIGDRSEWFEASEVPVTLEGHTLSENNAISVKISFDDWTDYIMLAPNIEGKKEFDLFESAKELFFLRKNKDGEVLRTFDACIHN